MKAPVLMVHGMCCTGEVWSGFRSFFEARGARVYTPTLRPDLRSNIREKPKRALRELGIADYVRQLEDEIALITRQHGRRPVVIGHSMGGLLAQVLAERGAVDAAVFISPSAPADVRDRRANLLWSALALSRRLGLAPWAIKSNRGFLDLAVFNLLPPQERAATYAAFVYESGRALRDLSNWPVDEKRIRVPVLTVAATQDRLVPANLVRMTGAKYAAIGGELREYASHGHWLYAEPGWQRPAGEIYDWLLAALARAQPKVEQERVLS